jgi:uncharacterized protein YbbC (DUF1343 family)
MPFQTFAADWINADTLASTLNGLGLPGVNLQAGSLQTILQYSQWQDGSRGADSPD